MTPSEWCRAGHPRQGEAQHLRAQIEFEKDMPYFVPLTNECVFSSMPFLVYRLLNEGYDALVAVPGLEKLKEEGLQITPRCRQKSNGLKAGLSL